MSVFPIPSGSYIVGRFDINVDANHNPGTVEVDVYPMYVTDRGHVDTDTWRTSLAHVEVPDTTEWGGDEWYDTGLTSTTGELADLPHDIQQAVDSALAQARVAVARG